ncbi:hypothetical protein EG68_09759 [Paragonimus skrjabini miyazakii]|uniref:Uncharacterized protein n=1 Tax=Paragonimus skrjabini miyazakii TaxID=59628 RepID=A0A8S9YS33_9TREM|nr:hypothetical protein EG68_09759 [Paragonimus skrjabini miyazakii]
MSNINLIDKAIKSFVEIPKVKNSKITYTRLQLLSYRFCSVAKQWPPCFDKRFMRLKNRRNPNLFPFFDRSYESRFNFRNGMSPRNASVYQKITGDGDKNCNLVMKTTESNKPRFHDDAIVSAQLSTQKLPENVVPRSGDFYDHQSLHSTWSRGRPKYFRYTYKEPEWYICGPQDAEDEMELDEYDMLNKDDEKENKFSAIPVNSSVFCVKNPVSDACLKNDGFPTADESHKNKNEDYLKSLLMKGVKKDGHKSDRSPNIKTLREIESRLKIHSIDSSASTDMSAYYKLLGLIGTSIQRESGSKGRTPLPVMNHKSTNNNQTESCITSTTYPSGTTKMLKDPAVSEVVSEGCCNCATRDSASGRPCLKTHNSSHLMQKLERLGKASKVACNPLAASYQRQVMATAPLGQNALRWFKAMTNAASASACISQHLDGSTATPSDQCYNTTSQGNLMLYIESTNPDEECPHMIENFANHSSMQSDCQAVPNLNNPVNLINSPRPRPTFGLPFYLHQSDNVLGSAMGLGMTINFPQRPIKPLMFYYHPHTTQLLGRPMIHPLLLQQLLQRQMDLKNAALQLPLNHSRQQSIMSTLNENTCLSTFNPSTGPHNEDSLEGSSSSEITYTYQQSSPLSQETHKTG